MSVKALIPRQDYSRYNGYISAVSDAQWLTVRGAQLRWNAYPTALKAAMQTGLEAYLLPAEAKEILSAERSDGQSYLALVMDMYQSWYAQTIIRQFAPAFVGAIDAAATTTADVWLTDSYNHITQELARMPIPPGLPEVTAALNPVIRIAYPQGARKYKGGVVLLWVPHHTAAEMWSAIGDAKTYNDMGNYFQKCRVSLKPWSYTPPVQMDSLSMLSSPYGHAINSIMSLMHRDTDNTGIFHISQNETMVGTLITDANLLTAVYTAETWYTGVYASAPAGRDFSDLYALVRFLGTYDATHNTPGSMTPFNDACLGTTMAANKMYAATIPHDGTSFTILADTGTIEVFCGACIAGMLDHSTNLTHTKVIGDGDGASVDVTFITLAEYMSLSSNWLPDVEARFFEKVLRGGSFEFGTALGVAQRSDVGRGPKGGSGRRKPPAGKDGASTGEEVSDTPKGGKRRNRNNRR